MTPAWPSWLSPIGYGQFTGAYVENDLTPLLIPLAFAAALIALVFGLQAVRDQGASLVAGRAGRATATPSATCTGTSMSAGVTMDRQRGRRIPEYSLCLRPSAAAAGSPLNAGITHAWRRAPVAGYKFKASRARMIRCGALPRP